MAKLDATGRDGVANCATGLSERAASDIDEIRQKTCRTLSSSR
jgi:hypothetical protein